MTTYYYSYIFVFMLNQNKYFYYSIILNILTFIYQKVLTFDINILHKLFDFKITFANYQCEYKNSKVDFVLKNEFGTFVLKISGIQK